MARVKKVDHFFSLARPELTAHLGEGWECREKGIIKQYAWGWGKVTLEMSTRTVPRWRVKLDYGLHLHALEANLALIDEHKGDRHSADAMHAYQRTAKRPVGTGSKESWIENYQQGPFLDAFKEVVPDPADLDEFFALYDSPVKLRDAAAQLSDDFLWLDDVAIVVGANVLLEDWDHLHAYHASLNAYRLDMYNECIGAFPEYMGKVPAIITNDN